MNSLDTRDFQSRLAHLEDLMRDAEQLTDPAARAQMQAIAQAVLDLHGVGLERLLGILDDAGAAGTAILSTCARDEIVGGLLILHGLHPVDLETRVREALDEVRPALRAHGGNVELVSMDDAVVRLRLEGNCHGCPSSAMTMKRTIEEAIIARAPDAAAIEVEGDATASSMTPDGRPLVVLSV